MKSKRVLIVGCGDLGTRAGTGLLTEGVDVIGLRRDCSGLPAGFAGLAADYCQKAPLSALEMLAPDFIIMTLKPAGTGAAAYRLGFGQAMRNVLDGLGAHRPAGIVMVSSVRVYAEREGGWVEEDSELAQDDPAALAIIEAEQLLLESSHPCCVLRCAGIYGNPDGALLRRVASGRLCAPTPPRYSNRIHRDDVGALLTHLLRQWAADRPVPQVMIGGDDEPAPRFEVESWLARQLQARQDVHGSRIRLLQGGDGSRADSPAAGDGPVAAQPRAHKRCRNVALQRSGFRLRYPDYRSGYAAVLAARETGAGGAD
ncbi:Rossmann-fold NAD(P)-binding domain-containing protein [Kineobactrum salinum]|uniref:Epimerase n=1 Tax=Kineobactrum salinum TaxID=2708301 RepID=A0A6C0U0Y8_9GAMM|nr:epimerase [Kineobactrum salinum]QIB65568.1 epimerase [Kineobactrum salinum]